MKINLCNQTATDAAITALGDLAGEMTHLEIILTGSAPREGAKQKPSVKYRKSKDTGKAVISGSAPTPHLLREAAVNAVAFAIRRVRDNVEKGKIPESYVSEARNCFTWPPDWDSAADALIAATAPKSAKTLREFVLRFGAYIARVRVPEPKAEKSRQSFADFTAFCNALTKETPKFSFQTGEEFDRAAKLAQVKTDIAEQVEKWRDAGMTDEQILASLTPAKPKTAKTGTAN